MEELSVNCVRLVQSLHCLVIIEELSGYQTLGVIRMLIATAKVFHYCDFRGHLSLSCPTFCQVGLDCWGILFEVVVLDMLDPIHVKVWWIVKVVKVTQCSL